MRNSHYIHKGVVLITVVKLCIATATYAPQNSSCPSYEIFRFADGSLTSAEEDWMRERDSISQVALTEWLVDSDLQDIDVVQYMHNISKSSPIRIGLAFSGGGYRAMLNGAGLIAALDNRVVGSKKKGAFGGLLQASSYITGLSGGSWLVGSIVANNWTSIPELQASDSLWNFQQPFAPSANRGPLNLKWDLSIIKDINDKMSAQHPVSITDLWGRLLGAQSFDSTANYGRNLLWSDQAIDHSMPFPIFVADGLPLINRTGHKNTRDGIPLNSTVYEITPFEFGSWDPAVNSFVETRYLGTELKNGQIVANNCTTGYDNTGFLMGASSSLFNEIIDGVISGPSKALFHRLIPHWNDFDEVLDMAIISPNPFYDVSQAIEGVSESLELPLVDGGENGETIPLAPLLQPSRSVDVVIAMDNSADTADNWPDGSALFDTFERQLMNDPGPPELLDSSSLKPNDSVKTSPIFYGCTNSQAGTTGGVSPLIIYMPNSFKSFASNQSTFKSSYSNHDRDEMIRNGYNIMTQNNGTIDHEWRSCVACAIILRSQQRLNMQVTDQCEACFDRYCYSN